MKRLGTDSAEFANPFVDLRDLCEDCSSELFVELRVLLEVFERDHGRCGEEAESVSRIMLGEELDGL